MSRFRDRGCAEISLAKSDRGCGGGCNRFHGYHSENVSEYLTLVYVYVF